MSLVDRLIQAGVQTGAVSPDLWAQIKGGLITNYGLSAQQADEAISWAKSQGYSPNTATINRIVDRVSPKEEQLQIEDVETSLIDNTSISKWYGNQNAPTTGGVTIDQPTGFDISTPTERSWFDKNKMWVLPVGGVVLLGGIYLLTKKKK